MRLSRQPPQPVFEPVPLPTSERELPPAIDFVPATQTPAAAALGLDSAPQAKPTVVALPGTEALQARHDLLDGVRGLLGQLESNQTLLGQLRSSQLEISIATIPGASGDPREKQELILSGAGLKLRVHTLHRESCSTSGYRRMDGPTYVKTVEKSFETEPPRGLFGWFRRFYVTSFVHLIPVWPKDLDKKMIAGNISDGLAARLGTPTPAPSAAPLAREAPDPTK